MAPEGDHYRTRLTHTLEACIISRTVQLAPERDLTEAVGPSRPWASALRAHRRGATSEDRGGFRHNEHLLRVVEVIEEGRDGPGLNLTEQVRDGILRHTGPQKPATLEGRLVRIVDRVAQINHDTDDAVRAGSSLRVRPAGRRDRVAGGDRGRARGRTGAGHGRAPRRWGHRAERGGLVGRCACASSCSTASIWGPRRGVSRAGAACTERPVRALPGPPRRSCRRPTPRRIRSG